MRYFVGYAGKGEVEQYYNAITTELSTMFGINNLSMRVPPHFTLKYPFETNDTSVAERRIEDFLKNRIPIEFLVDGFGRFDDNNETIFLSPTRTDTLDAFVEECIINLGDLNEEKKFDPKKFRVHMSIARHLTDEMFEQIWSYVNSLPQPHFQLILDDLTLFVLKDEKWEIKRVFKIT